MTSYPSLSTIACVSILAASLCACANSSKITERPGAEACAVEGDGHTCYFEGTVRVELPAGLTDDIFVEYQPGFARVAAPVEIPGAEGSGVGVLNFVALTTFERDPKVEVSELRDQLLQGFGYPPDSELVDEASVSEGTHRWIYEVPAAGELGPGTLLLTINIGGEGVSALAFEATRDSWGSVADSLKRSGESLETLY